MALVNVGDQPGITAPLDFFDPAGFTIDITESRFNPVKKQSRKALAIMATLKAKGKGTGKVDVIAQRLEPKASCHEAQATELEAKATELETKAGGHDAKATELETKVSGYEASAKELKAKATVSETTTIGHEAKATKLEAKAIELETKASGHEANVIELEAKAIDLETKAQALNSYSEFYIGDASDFSDNSVDDIWSIDWCNIECCAKQNTLRKDGIPSCSLEKFSSTSVVELRDPSTKAQAREEFSKLDQQTQDKLKMLSKECRVQKLMSPNRGRSRPGATAHRKQRPRHGLQKKNSKYVTT